MTEDDLIIQRLRMARDRLKKENEKLYKENGELYSERAEMRTKIENLEDTLKEEWSVLKIHYCTRCGRPMPDAAWSDEINKYCDICAGDMGVK